jgi:hypothetical protein
MKRTRFLFLLAGVFLLSLRAAQAQSCAQYTQGQAPPYELGLICQFTATSAPFGAFKTNGVLYWRVSWVPSGTISSASLSLDSSTTGLSGSWTTGGILAAATIGSIASAGNYGPNATATTPSNYGQLTPTITGSGSITVVLLGYSENPNSAGTNPTPGKVPYNNAGLFSDSPMTVTSSLVVNFSASGMFCGPSPWIDVVCYGAKGDGLYNNTATTLTTSGTTTLTTTSGNTLFAATDCSGGSGCTGTQNKLIVVNGGASTGGVAMPTPGTIAFTSAGSLTLPNACIQITAIQDNQTLPITTTGPSINGESQPTAEVCGGAISGKEVTMTAPLLPSGATGYRPYFTDEGPNSYREVAQIVPGVANAMCSSQSAQNIRDGACDPTATLTLNSITYIGFKPPQKNSWLSTIASFVTTRSVKLTDAIPSDVTSATMTAWATANDNAYANALAACPSNGGVAILFDNGCTLLFPPSGTQSSPANGTGRYASQNGLLVLQGAVMIKMPGAASSLPNSGTATLYTNWGSESLWTMGRSWGVQYGNSATWFSGGGSEQAMANDMSGVGYGGLFVTAPLSHISDHFRFNNFVALNYFSGTCLTVSALQISKFNNSGGLCADGIWMQDYSSNNEWIGDEVVGTNTTGGAPGYGILMSDNPSSGTSASITGNNQVSAPKIRDFWQGPLRIKYGSNNSVYQAKVENINLSGFAACPGGGTACSGTGITIDDALATGRSNQNQIVGGSWARLANIYNLGLNVGQADIMEINPQQISGNTAAICTDNSTGADIFMGNYNPALCPNKLNGNVLVSAQQTVQRTAQTSGIATTTLCSATNCGYPGTYQISASFWGSGTACSSVTAGSVALTLTWTDGNGTTHSAVAFPLFDQSKGALGTSFFFSTSLATEGASGDFKIDSNGSAIQYAATYIACTTGTGTYNLDLTAMRVR